MNIPENISPTALATGHMWYRHGLSHPAFVTFKGRLLDRSFSTFSGAAAIATGLSFDDLMRARHQGIDDRLTAAIESGKVTQVIELAAGLSPRGWRFKKRYGDKLRYIETDLPHMVAHKKKLLADAGLESAGHSVQSLNVLKASGADSLSGLADQLDPENGVAVITEGLMNYLDRDQAEFVWQEVTQLLGRFPQGQYLSDFYLSSEIPSVLAQSLLGMLKVFVRSNVHIHYATSAEATAQLRGLGFADVQLHHAEQLSGNRLLADKKGAQQVRVLEAWAAKKIPRAAVD